ncbi:MAG: hypothetical protein ACPHK8_04590 [Thermoplasmatota archaeon]
MYPPSAPIRLPNQASQRRQPPFINLSGDYRFLRGGYWALVDAELNGLESRPSPLQAVTAQNCAAALLVAKQAPNGKLRAGPKTSKNQASWSQTADTPTTTTTPCPPSRCQASGEVPPKMAPGPPSPCAATGPCAP